MDPLELSRWQADEALALGTGRLLLRWPTLGAEVELQLTMLEEPDYLRVRSDRFEVDVWFEPGGLRLFHCGTSRTEEAEAVLSSWRTSLALLRHYLEQHSGRARSVLWVSFSAPVPPETTHVYFTQGPALASWLGRGAIGAAQTTFRLELLDGGTLSGLVLANTPGRDVALSCSAQGNSALVLRTFPAAGGVQRVALMWSSWGSPIPAEVSATLRAAYERLRRRLERPLET